MLVILLKDVKGTGRSGDVVEVSDGYARNMLIPKKMAKPATDGNIKSLKKQKEILAEREEAARQRALELKDKLAGLTVEVAARGGENGRLFGSVTTKDIAEALQEQHGIRIDKKKIVMNDPIREAGAAEVICKLYPEISGPLAVQVKIKE